jgi:uncharacterized membrane protein
VIALVKWIQLLALGVWVGETVFLSFVVAPALFGRLPEQAGPVMSLLFPDYYRVAYACGALLVVAGAILWRATRDSPVRWGVFTTVAAAMLAASLWAGVMIQPRAHELRPQLHQESVPPAVREEFDRLHARAVQLNGAVLLGNLILIGIAASRIEV